MSHGKNQLKRNKQRHLEHKRERQRRELESRPVQTPPSYVKNGPQWATKEYIERQLALERADMVLGLLQKLHDLLVQRVNDLTVKLPFIGVEEAAATPAEVERMVAQAAAAPEPVVCPLCKYPITVDDAISNMTTVRVNRKAVQVHKVCPGEKNG